MITKNFRVWNGKKMVVYTFNKKDIVLKATGIKSTKNKDVFEGDIVYVYHEHEVKSLESESWYVVEKDKKEKRFDKFILVHKKGSKVGCRFEPRWKYEVVGNIFENKNVKTS